MWKLGEPRVCGIFERDVPGIESPGYARWNGKRWYRLCRTVQEAAEEQRPSDFQGTAAAHIRWRPLEEEAREQVAA